MVYEALSYPFFQRALLAVILASVACGIVGSFVVVKRIASISGGISHAALGGVGMAYYFGFNPVAGATLVSIVFSALVGRAYLERQQGLDTLIAIMWSFGMALGVLLIALTPGYAPDLNGYLFGSILFVPPEYLYLVAGLDVVLIVAMFFFFSCFQAIAFDEEFAAIRGVPVQRFFLSLLMLTALSVVTLMRVVGVIMLIALLTVPAVIARQWSDSLLRMMVLASLVSMGCSVIGLFCSYWLSAAYAIHAPSGALIILVTVICYLLSSLLAGRALRAKATP